MSRGCAGERTDGRDRWPGLRAGSRPDRPERRVADAIAAPEVGRPSDRETARAENRADPPKLEIRDRSQAVQHFLLEPERSWKDKSHGYRLAIAPGSLRPEQ